MPGAPGLAVVAAGYGLCCGCPAHAAAPFRACTSQNPTLATKEHLINITAAATLAESLMAQHGLTDAGWTFKVDRATTRLGLCQYGPKVISMGAAYVGSADESSVRDTVLHEIAHALVGPYVLTPTGAVVRDRQRRAVKTGHGWQWKVTEREIGCSGQRSGHNPAAAAKQDAIVNAAKARAEHVAHITTGPLQIGELVQTRNGSYKGILTNIARVNGTIQNERDGKPWRVPLANLYRSIGGHAS